MKCDFIDWYNTIAGAVVAALTVIFGTYWYLFAGYMMLNILDWLTGWYKSSRRHEESSMVGLKGILKKTGYWAIILVAFMMPDMFIKLGRDALGMDLSFLMMVGWLTLAMLLVNEVRSILENLVECGYEVPEVLIKSLAITEKLMKAQAEAALHTDEGGSNDKL